IGIEAVVRAPGDGYTLLVVGTTAAINATLFEKLNYNFIRDIAPVASIVRVPHVMQVNPSLPVGIARHLKGYPADVRMIWPVAKRGRPRQWHVPDIPSIPAEDMLADAKWRTISWRTGTKGKLKARFAAARVRVADGPPQRIRDKGQQHLPG